LKIKAVDSDAYFKDDDAPYYAPSTGASFRLQDVEDWRDLVGQSIEEQLPEDTDVSVYVGIHRFALSYRVQIIDRREDEFLVNANWDIHCPVDVYGWVPFTGVLVNVDEDMFRDRVRAFDLLNPDDEELPPTPERDMLYADLIAHASGALRNHFDMDEFDEPEIRNFFCVWFPLKSTNGKGG